MVKDIFIDTETTGLDPNVDTLKELSLIYLENKKEKLRYTIINNNEYLLLKDFTDKLKTIIDPYKVNDKANFIAYNTKFDEDFIRTRLKKQNPKYKLLNYGNYFDKSICLYEYSKFKFWLKGKKPKSYKLIDIANYFKLSINESKLHTAEYDVDITYKVYKKLIKM